MPGGYFVSQAFENIDARPNKNNACILASPGKLGVLRQEAVPWMDGIDLMSDGQPDDGIDVEVGAQRLARLSHAIRLIRLESM